MMQIPLPIDWSNRRDGGEIIVMPANEAALARLADPSTWSSHCMLLVGPPRSGRTTIANGIADGRMADVIDDADEQDETALFHAWNRARDAGRKLLLIAGAPPPTWPIALPDLRSRLSAADVARILPPEETDLAALINHGLARAGTAAAPDVAPWIAARLERSHAVADRSVHILNDWSLSSGRKISVLKAKELLSDHGVLPHH